MPAAMLIKTLLSAFLAVSMVMAQRPPHMRPISLEGCGVHKGCIVLGPKDCHMGPRGHADCDGVFTQELSHENPHIIRVQLFARNVAGWVAVGFNTEPHMNGTDVVACQLDSEHRVVVKNLHNVNHTNHVDSEHIIDPYLSDTAGAFVDGNIECQFDRPLVTPNELFDLDLSKPHHILSAWNYNGTAPADGPLMHMHQAKPLVSNQTHTAADVFFYNISINASQDTPVKAVPIIDLTGCGKTKGCSRAPAGCASAESDCYYVMTQQADHDTGNARFEIAAVVGGWAAVGYNFNNTMNGTDVVGCQLTPDGAQVVVKKLHNVNFTNILDSTNISQGLTDVQAQFVNNRIICTFTRSIFPIASDPYSRDLSIASYVILAANVNGTAKPTECLVHKHNVEPFFLPQMHTVLDMFNYNGTAEEPDMPMQKHHAHHTV